MDTIAKTTILDIPDEILEKIFLQLSTHDVQQNLAKVCKRFLKVSRFSTMVSKIWLTIENMADEDEMEKVETAVRLFPAASLELIYEQDYVESFTKGRNEFRLENFEPFVSSLTKLTLELYERNDFRRMTETQIRFLALEYLKLDIDLDIPINSYLKIPERFLDNFPNLTSLTIHCDNSELYPLLNALSERCPKLERFIYRNFAKNIWRLKYDNEDKGKLMNLKKIHVELDPVYLQGEMPRLAIEKLRKYLSVICPNLDDPIQVDEEEFGTIVFESGPPNDDDP